MALKREELARELAEIAKKTGVRRNDAVMLKTLVESLAASEARLPADKQKGYARIFREYSPAGYTVLFKLVDKHWPIQPGEAAPETPKAEPMSRPPQTYAWVVEFCEEIDPLVIVGLLTAKLKDVDASTRIVKFGQTTKTKLLELLVEQHSPLQSVNKVMRSIEGLDRLRCRSAADFGMPVFQSPVLRQWYADGPITCGSLHRAA